MLRSTSAFHRQGAELKRVYKIPVGQCCRHGKMHLHLGAWRRCGRGRSCSPQVTLSKGRQAPAFPEDILGQRAHLMQLQFIAVRSPQICDIRCRVACVCFHCIIGAQRTQFLPPLHCEHDVAEIGPREEPPGSRVDGESVGGKNCSYRWWTLVAG